MVLMHRELQVVMAVLVVVVEEVTLALVAQEYFTFSTRMEAL
jgi:hypothetical protein